MLLGSHHGQLRYGNVWIMWLRMIPLEAVDFSCLMLVLASCCQHGLILSMENACLLNLQQLVQQLEEAEDR